MEEDYAIYCLESNDSKDSPSVKIHSKHQPISGLDLESLSFKVFMPEKSIKSALNNLMNVPVLNLENSKHYSEP